MFGVVLSPVTLPILYRKWCPCCFCLCAWRKAEPSAASDLSHLKSDRLLHSSFSKILWVPSLCLSHKSCFSQSKEPSWSYHCPGWQQRSKRRTFLGWWGNERWAQCCRFQTCIFELLLLVISGRNLTRPSNINHLRGEFLFRLCCSGIGVVGPQVKGKHISTS